MRRAALFCDGPAVDEVYGRGRRERLAGLVDLYPEVVSAGTFPGHVEKLGGLEAIFSTWGMPALRPGDLDRLPRLKAVFYAAGTVKAFARPFLERDIAVVSVREANAVPVAEFALAQMVLAAKGYFRNLRGGATFLGRGCYGETVALLGAGAVGRALIERLAGLRLKVLVYDPFLAAAEATRLGVERVSLQEAFGRAYVVSNHLPDLPATRGLLARPLFESMRPDASFINTGRGATVVEADLAAVLKARPDLTALLDVTFPEPPSPDSPLRSLPNVLLSPHMAGSIGDEVLRMADAAIEAFSVWDRGGTPPGLVTLAMLDRMA